VTIGTSGNALFRPGGRVVAGAARTIDFRTSAGQILDDAADTPSFVGGALALVGSTIGGGTSNPVNTQVSRLEAQAGSMFIQNSGPLAIGGVTGTLNGLFATSRDSTGASIFVRNDQTISIVTPGDIVSTFIGGGLIGSVSIEATRADADIVASEALTTFGRAITLNAGRDIVLGDAAANRAGNVVGEGVNLIAGRSIRISGPTQIFSSSSAPIIATAVQSITVTPPSTPTEENAPQFRSRGNVTLVAGDAIDLNNGAASRPVIRVNESGGTSKIDLAANEMNIASRLDAGTAGLVFLRQSTPTQPVSVGFESAGTLSISDAELDRIAAGNVTIGSATHAGNITVDGSITRPASTTYGALTLETDGALFVNGDVELGTGALTLNSRNTISAFANVTASAVSATSRSGSALLNGRLRVGSLAATASNGNVSANNDRNEIGALGAILFNNQFNLKDSAGGLTTTGLIDGGASSNATIEVRGGQLVLNPGTKIFFSGAGNDLRLFSDTGFTNNVDSSVLVPENGARWLIYSPSAAVTTLGGLAPNFTLTGVSFPERPVNSGNGVLFVTGSAAPTGGTGGGSTGTGTAGVAPPPGATGTAASGLDETSDMQGFVFRPVALQFQGTPPTMESAAAALRTLGRVDLDRAAADSPDFRAFVNAMGAVNDSLVDYRLRLTRLIAKDESIMIGEQAAFLKRMVTNVDDAMNKVSTAFTRFFVGDDMTANRLRAVALNALTDPIQLMQEVDRLEGLNQGQRDRAARLEAEAAQRARDAAIAAAEAKLQADIAEAKRVRALEAARKSVVISGGRLIFVPNGSELQYDRERLPIFNAPTAEELGLGQTIGTAEIQRMARASGGRLTEEDVRKIVNAGGNKITPGVIAAIISAAGSTIVSGGAGNLTQNQVNAIIAGGAGNLTRAAQFAVISAGIISSDGASLLGNDLAGIIAGGGGNIISNDGASLLGQDGAGIISGGAGNFTTEMASFITNGVIPPGNIAAIIAGGGGNINPGAAGNIVSGGAGNFNVLSGMVAGLISPGERAAIVSGGAGNFANLASLAGIISNDGASLLGQDGAGLLGDMGSGLIARPGASVLGDQGSGMFGQNNASVISGNSGAIISGNSGAIISGNSGAIISGNSGALTGSSSGGSNLVAR
jgi:hypothetical protein